MNLKDKLLCEVFGNRYFESYFIDSILEVFADGLPRTAIPKAPADTMRTYERVKNYVLANGLLTQHGDVLIITSKGKLFLDTGGCRSDYLNRKLGRLGFVLSLFATALSVVAMIIALVM